MAIDAAKKTRSGGWRTIQTALLDEILSGQLDHGTKLPIERDLMARFGLGRHSVRLAVAELSDMGYLRVEQGHGTFVHHPGPVDYRISERTRFSQNLLGSGRDPNGRMLAWEEIDPPERVAEVLRLVDGARVYHLTSQSWADGEPLGLGHSYVPVARFPEFPKAKRRLGSTTATFRFFGIDDYLRASTVLTARMPTRREAAALRQPTSLPVILSTKVDVDSDGVPISYSETVWASERIQFSVDHTPHGSAAPGGESK